MFSKQKIPASFGTALVIIAVCCCPVVAETKKPVPSASAALDCVNLNAAVQTGDAGKVEALLDQGADVDCRNGNYDETPLMQAAADGSLEVVKVLVRHGASLAPTGTFHGRIPLTLAAANKNAHNNNLDVVEFLVENGADVNANCTEKGGSAYLAMEQVGPRNLSPLGAAVVGENLPVTEYLLQHKANVNGRDGSAYTPLHWACAEGNAKIVQMLLRYGADPKITTDKGQTARNFAALRNHKDILALLDAAENQRAKPNNKKP